MFQKNYDFKFQEKCNLVYADLLEHAILHGRILLNKEKNGASMKELRNLPNGYDSVFKNIRKSHYKVFDLNSCEFNKIATELNKKFPDK